MVAAGVTPLSAKAGARALASRCSNDDLGANRHFPDLAVPASVKGYNPKPLQKSYK